MAQPTPCCDDDVRALGIPTVMGADIQPSVLHRRTLIVDGYGGELLVNPEPVLLRSGG
ncbi:hypothetical protein ACNKHW_17785 [Shigella flexneri]